MKSIKEKAEEYSFIRQGVGSSGIQYRDFSINKKDGFIAGANYVLGEIENFMKGLDLGNSAEEKFYKLDVIADIGLFIEQLKK